ncbi:MAG: hypothetical protein FJ279_30925, partial [Planctomycetes bacterium]|nr:hypothetical protein [Planctomycetota bacterium]
MRSSKGLSAFCILHFALAILLSLAPGCGRKLAEVNVYITDEKTRLESEVLGKYQDLATEPLVIPSAKASSPPGAPALPLSGKAAQEALRQFQDNLAFLRKPGPMFAGRREQECATLYNIAALHSSLGQTAEALKSLGEAEQLADACQLFDLKWKILFEQALLRDADRLALLRKAVDALETAPQFMVKAAPANARLKGNLYQNVVLDLMAKNEVEPALAYAERFATQETVCLLAHEVLAFSDPNHAEFMAGFDEAKAKLLAAHARLAAATDATRPKAQKDFQAALKQYRDHIAKPPAEAAALAPLLRVTAPEAVEVLEYLPKDTCLVRYFLTPQKVVAWTLSAEGLRPAMVEAGRPFNETLGRLSANPLRYTADDLAVLSKTLVEPVAARLEKTARVYLVAEGKLSNVPWPELPCGKGRMIDRFQLGFAASLTHF